MVGVSVVDRVRVEECDPTVRDMVVSKVGELKLSLSDTLNVGEPETLSVGDNDKVGLGVPVGDAETSLEPVGGDAVLEKDVATVMLTVWVIEIETVMLPRLAVTSEL